MKRILLLFLFIAPGIVIAQKKKSKKTSIEIRSSTLQIVDARVEQLANPLGLDIKQPRFSWVLKSLEKNTMQTAYEIIIASSSDFAPKNILWTSKLNTDQSIYNKYEGPVLISNFKYYWKVTVWDNHGNVATSGSPLFWHTGFMNATDWTAKWVSVNRALSNNLNKTVSPLFRKEFSLAKDIKGSSH